MLVKLVKSYPDRNEDGTAKLNSKTGRPRMNFMYTVHGTKQELAEYKAAQGGDLPEGENNHYREDEKGTALWFTQRPIGMTGQVKISQNGKVFADTTDIDLAASLIDNYGSVGMLMAKDILGATSMNLAKAMIESTPEKID